MKKLKALKEKYVEWACTPKGTKVIGRVCKGVCTVLGGVMAYSLFDAGRAQGQLDILVEEKELLESLSAKTEEVIEILEEGQ